MDDRVGAETDCEGRCLVGSCFGGMNLEELGRERLHTVKHGDLEPGCPDYGEPSCK